MCAVMLRSIKGVESLIYKVYLIKLSSYLIKIDGATQLTALLTTPLAAVMLQL
jgi:hypothetical protein